MISVELAVQPLRAFTPVTAVAIVRLESHKRSSTSTVPGGRVVWLVMGCRARLRTRAGVSQKSAHMM